MVLLRWDWLAPLHLSVPLAVGALTKQRKKVATQAFFVFISHLANKFAVGGKVVRLTARRIGSLRFAFPCHSPWGPLQNNARELLRKPFLFYTLALQINLRWGIKQKKMSLGHLLAVVLWELTDSNRRPSACKADALNQLS